MKVLAKLKIPAKLESLEKIINFVSTQAREQGVSYEKINKLELGTEEIVVNIFNYSYPDAPGEVEINSKLDDSNFIIEIIDSGIPFDINMVSAPDLTSDISDRAVGGVGVFLVKKMVDKIDYRRENNQNILNLTVRKDKDG